MALTKNPKLALIPSGYKASKVYSVLPSDGVGDFDFSRSGNATRVNKQGLIETVSSNVPRLNYPLIDGVVSGCPSLLLENSATNLITYSEDFSDASWATSTTTITTNQGISLSGDLSADEVVTIANKGIVSNSISIPNDAFTRTQSIFIKYVSGTSEFMLRGVYIGGTSVAKFSKFDLSNGTIISTNTTAKIEDYDNGWFRISQQITNNNSGNITFISQLYTTNDTISTNNLLLWGAQLEQGSYPTSYIPTNGSATTRSAETCNNAGDVNTFNDSQGVLMAEVNFENNDTNKGISISDGTSSNRILFYLATNGNLYGYVFNGNGSIPIVTIIDTNFQINSTAKLAIKYKQNDFALWVNGIEIGTEPSGNTFSSGVLDKLSFTSYGPSANPFYGNTKQIQYFDTALTDTDLEQLTSWTSFNEMANAQLYTIL